MIVEQHFDAPGAFKMALEGLGRRQEPV